MMIRNIIISRLIRLTCNKNVPRNCSSQINLKKLESEAEEVEVVEDEGLKEKHDEIELKRNKSRLKVQDYRMLHEENPYPEPTFWHHGTIKYMRRTYGKYGAASGVDPSLCWPVKEELEDAIEYEAIKYPYNIPEVVEAAKAKKIEDEKIRWERQKEIVKKMAKLEQWKQELHAKIEEKEQAATEAKLRKDRLIEEVRRHFGYTVDPRDDKFKELLEKKEKEQKKAMREARKKERADNLVKKLLNKKKPENVVEETGNK